MTRRIYGHTKSGKSIDDRLIEGLAHEAERGYDPRPAPRQAAWPGPPTTR
jgi:hypothetical protein